MPIRRDLRHLYRGPAWRETRARILERAGNACEHCRAPNHITVLRKHEWWTPASLEATVFANGGTIDGLNVEELQWTCGSASFFAHFPMSSDTHWSGIQLGVAHLNHDPTDNRNENLKALCRRCHLIHDKGHHRHTRSARKDAARPLLTTIQDERMEA